MVYSGQGLVSIITDITLLYTLADVYMPLVLLLIVILLLLPFLLTSEVIAVNRG